MEDEIERANHIHFSKPLTYAGNLNAVIVVWLVKSLKDIDRETLEWLNKVTDKKVNFFGIEIESWRTGQLEIAPQFNVISKPNN